MNRHQPTPISHIHIFLALYVYKFITTPHHTFNNEMISCTLKMQQQAPSTSSDPQASNNPTSFIQESQPAKKKKQQQLEPHYFPPAQPRIRKVYKKGKNREEKKNIHTHRVHYTHKRPHKQKNTNYHCASGPLIFSNHSSTSRCPADTSRFLCRFRSLRTSSHLFKILATSSAFLVPACLLTAWITHRCRALLMLTGIPSLIVLWTAATAIARPIVGPGA
jgi:hypothetical protein